MDLRQNLRERGLPRFEVLIFFRRESENRSEKHTRYLTLKKLNILEEVFKVFSEHMFERKGKCSTEDGIEPKPAEYQVG